MQHNEIFRTFWSLITYITIQQCEQQQENSFHETARWKENTVSCTLSHTMYFKRQLQHYMCSAILTLSRTIFFMPFNKPETTLIRDVEKSKVFFFGLPSMGWRNNIENLFTTFGHPKWLQLWLECYANSTKKSKSPIFYTESKTNISMIKSKEDSKTSLPLLSWSSHWLQYIRW